MTDEGNLVQAGAVWERKDNKWQDDEAEGEQIEWENWYGAIVLQDVQVKLKLHFESF